MLWMFVAWSFPLIGPLLFLLIGINRAERKGWQKHRVSSKFKAARQAREDAELPMAYWRAVHKSLAAEPCDPAALELHHVMNGILPDYPLLGGNHVEPLVTGDKAYPRMLDAIREARHHVHMQTFIVRDDAVGREFLDLLAQKAREGVVVRFMFDRFGSTGALLRRLFVRYKGVPNMHFAGWTQVSAIRRCFQVNLRNHRKTLIVDGRVAFTGGVNLHVENTTRPCGGPIRDYHFAVRGPVVQELQYSFLNDWYFMTDEDPEALLQQEHFPQIEPAGDALVRLANGGPTADEVNVMPDIFVQCITSARRQVLAVTPYFVPTQDILRALRLAALRGVDTRIVVPRENNHLYAGLAGRALYEELLEAGVRIFERCPPFMHAKALIIDDSAAVVGSANIDVRSLRLNYESNLMIFDDPFVNTLKAIVLQDIGESVEIHLTEWRRRPAYRALVENFCNLLTPML